MTKRLILLLTLFTASLAVGQTTTLLPQGGLGISCNAITTATSANPGASGGCTSLALVTSGGTLPGNYTWQVITTGTPATLTVNFVGSLDGVTWVQLDTTSTTTGATKTVANANSYRFLGCIPATLTGGSSPTVTCQISVTSTASGGGSGTVTNTGGNLTANAVVLGAGTNDTKVSTGITTNGASELDLGVSGTSGVLGLKGSTSGTFTATTDATAANTTLTGAILPAVSNNALGSASFRWSLAATSGNFTGTITSGGTIVNGSTGHLFFSPTAPSILAAGCGGSAASIVANNGPAAFQVNVGTSNTGACTITSGLGTITSVVLQNYTDISGTGAWVDSDKLVVSCWAY